jgi:adenylate kinase
MQLQNVILLMGPPGSGKGTQSKLLVEKLGYADFSMGDTLREYAKMETELGREIKKTIDQGIIVPDEISKQIFEEKFAGFLDRKGLVLDGYPRTLGQVEVLGNLIKQYNLPFRVLFLDVDKQKLLNRLSLRSKSQGRADDTDVAAVEKRFDEYMVKTAPVKNRYESEGALVHINGDQTIEQVQQEIISKI